MASHWTSELPRFPLPNGAKFPPPRGWQQSANNNPDLIAEYRRLGRNLGIKCGKGSIFVIDVDAQAALDRMLQAAGVPLPAGHTVFTSVDPETGFKKRQHYFWYPEVEHNIGNHTHLFARGEEKHGVDIRTEGGYVAGEGSKVPGHLYVSEDDLEPAAVLPPEFIRAIEAEAKYQAGKQTGASAGSAKIKKGSRNDTLYRRYACVYRARGYDFERIYALLKIDNRELCEPPLDERQVRTIAEQAAKHSPGQAQKEAVKRTLFLRTKKGSELSKTEAAWLWYQVVRFGVLNLFVGMPDEGKTLMAIFIIAYLTTGRKFPFSKQQVRPGQAVVICSEDDEIMWRQRLSAAGADLERVEFVTSVGVTETGEVIPWCLDDAEHLALLKGLLVEGKFALCLIDPIGDKVPHSNLNDSGSARQALAPFNEIAKETGVAMLINAHSTKALIDSVIKAAAGSIQIMAAMSVAFYFMKDPHKQGRRLMLQARNKAGTGHVGFSYHIEGLYPEWYTRNQDEPEKDPGIGAVVFDGVSDVDPNEYLQDAQVKDATKVGRCCSFLLEFLARGPVVREKCLDALRTCGFSQDVINDACAKLKIRRPRKAPSLWSLPTDADKQKSAAELVAEDMSLIEDKEFEDLSTSFDYAVEGE